MARYSPSNWKDRGMSDKQIEPLCQRYMHRKTGGHYQVVGVAKAQVIDAIRDMDEVVIYRSEKDGSLWVRPKDEFLDGRFAAIP